ncbi:MAG: betaine/proline/choline family ABC transporter ATP-binding protein [Anaerovorax sp.]|nr:betaine/proline/choline family ABC transporter ATP-binding protein [Anaerovorax sp.]
MIEFKNVTKQYADGFEAIKSIDLKVERAEILTLIGPSGCGKTTTMKMINRLIEPTSGQILVEGEDIKNVDPVELRRNIGYVIQQIGLMPHMTIEDNIALIPRLKKWPKERYLAKVDELLDMVGLDPSLYKKRYPNELSGGQQQRIGVIRALAGDPQIILMDEPFSALDPLSREQLQDELIRLQEEIQKTVVFVTHDMDEALKISTRIAIMRSGNILQLDTPDRILRRPKDKFVREFIGEKRRMEGIGNPTASDLMQQKAVSISPKRGLAEAFQVIKNERVDKLFVVGKQMELLGVVSLEKLTDHYKEEDKTVLDIMDKQVIKVHTDEAVGEVADIFTNRDINAIPVVTDGKLSGVITRTSLIRGIAEWEQKKGGDENE